MTQPHAHNCDSNRILRASLMYFVCIHFFPISLSSRFRCLMHYSLADAMQPNGGKFIAFDHITFYVGNAKQAASYYTTRLGFKPCAYQGLETGHRKFAKHVVRQNKVNLSRTYCNCADHCSTFTVHCSVCVCRPVGNG